MENLEIYNKIKTVPNEAQKKITGGRLNGMTDIKPMWRIEKLTEIFGPVGKGWKTKTTKKEIIDGANDEKIATVDIELYVKYENEWSEPIEGSGGSSFIAKERNGLYTSDECFKMAYTDALSVACKALGMGADVYWGDSKYDTGKKITTKKEAEKYVITFGKKHKDKTLKEVIENDYDYIEWILQNSNDENLKNAICLITGETMLDENEQDEKLILIAKLNEKMLLKNVDREKLYKHYKVQSNTEMTIEQLKEAIEKLN